MNSPEQGKGKVAAAVVEHPIARGVKGGGAGLAAEPRRPRRRRDDRSRAIAPSDVAGWRWVGVVEWRESAWPPLTPFYSRRRAEKGRAGTGREDGYTFLLSARRGRVGDALPRLCVRARVGSTARACACAQRARRGGSLTVRHAKSPGGNPAPVHISCIPKFSLRWGRRSRLKLRSGVSHKVS